MVTAPVTNKKIANTPIEVTLPNGASIKSSHTCDLILPQLPDKVNTAHVIRPFHEFRPLRRTVG
jgi:hypothetical protein